ncbi:MAG: winged helix-turn-helix domain-containing protein, partial [Eggerthellaceae bacterium]|nr:winged helix-turn-helix domain-containing protein [Eggerthellaceae bacterium]
DGSFDFIVSRNVTWTLEDVDAVYAEVWRVLKDGGVFLNLDANYGRCFNEADSRGEVPTHPTQTLEQLRTRNDIAHDLAITLVDRPQWDIDQFWRLGASEIRCRSIGGGTNASGSQMFALEVHKRSASSKGQGVVNALDTPSQAALSGVGAVSKDRAGEMVRAKVMLVDYVRMGDFEFDPRKFVIRKNGVPIKLTPKEFNVLLTLARNPGKLVTRTELKAAAWGSEFVEDDGSIAVYIRRIREKLEDDPSRPRYLLTHRGKGYSFDPTGGKA